jgi:hypothetical protein
MIANGPANKGLAPQARLFSSALGPPPANAVKLYEDSLLAIQHLTRPAGSYSGVAAVNLSYGVARAGGAPLDGGSLLSKGMDWLSIVDNALFVSATHEKGLTGTLATGVVPQDDYNGITVGSTSRDRFTGIFSIVDRDTAELARRRHYGRERPL